MAYTPDEIFSLNEYTILKFSVIDSTNEEAKRRIRAGKREECALWALGQTSGRGRYGRQWVSPEGNFFLSLIIPVAMPIPQAAQLSFVAAVAVGEALVEIIGDKNRIAYKWPNDVLLDGRKIAGILLESSAPAGVHTPDAVIIGIGINLASCPEGMPFPATSLSEVGIDLSARECLQILLKSFTKWRNPWQYKGLLLVREAWLARAWAKGEKIKADIGTEVLHGLFEDMTETGELVLREQDGNRRCISAGEIFFGDV